MGSAMNEDTRLSLLKRAWNFSFIQDQQIAINVEKMYYKKYFKDEVEKYLDYLDAFEMLYKKKYSGECKKP